VRLCLSELGRFIDVGYSSANPSLLALFPTHHGLVEISALPASHTVLAPSDKLSTLRGLLSSPSGTGGGENNLAFKCMRKRMMFETLHLDLEGGVGERRTTVGPNTRVNPINDADRKEGDKGEAVVGIHLEEVGGGSVAVASKKKKKAVGFASDRPDISYEF
jgi:elongator complex protein 4